jgi:hypothetical protein
MLDKLVLYKLELAPLAFKMQKLYPTQFNPFCGGCVSMIVAASCDIEARKMSMDYNNEHRSGSLWGQTLDYNMACVTCSAIGITYDEPRIVLKTMQD